MAIEGTNIRCDSRCCAYCKKLGEVHPGVNGGSVLLVSRQHGKKHTGHISIVDLLPLVVGTLSADAIHIWVESNYGNNRF